MQSGLSWGEVIALVSALIAGFGLIGSWLYRIDRKHERKHELHDERHARNEARLQIVEAEAVKRAEFTSLVTRLESEIRDGFRSLTERIDRMWEHRKD